MIHLEQLREGTAKVRSVLGSEESITDKDIQDSLWHYYYDTEKTINYLLSTHRFIQMSRDFIDRF